VLEEHRLTVGRLGLTVIRDGNGTRSLETLMRYRGAALAEFMRCLNTLQALQAEARAAALAAPARRRRGRPIVPAHGRASQRPAAQAAPPGARPGREGPPGQSIGATFRPAARPAHRSGARPRGHLTGARRTLRRNQTNPGKRPETRCWLSSDTPFAVRPGDRPHRPLLCPKTQENGLDISLRS
jgi:hypothetical protein